ncbi:MAG: carbohydrate ABC transporter permease [Planctomycetes bacterium]|nr:carbohydrate ABC transporter permease [Planctomycetota bacterium]
MPIIATTGRKYWRVRVLIWTMYAILVVGSLTMFYPFGMMLSMSVSGLNDNMEQQLVPRYVKEKLAGGTPDALFRRYVSLRLKIDDFNRLHRSRYVDYSYGLPGQTATGIFARFQRIRPVPFDLKNARFNRVVEDALAFKTWYATGKDPSGVMPDDEGRMLNMTVAFPTQRANNTLNPTLDRYVDWLKARYDESLVEVNKAYREESEFWADVFMPYEQPHLVTWLPNTRSRKVREFLEFKKDLAAESINFLTLPDLNYYTLFSREYNSEERFQKQTGRKINSFYEVKPSPHAPDVVVPDDLIRQYCRETFGSVTCLNMLFGTSFSTWEEITFPTPGSANRNTVPILSTFTRYVLGQKADVSFRMFLKKEFGVGEFQQKYDVELPPLPEVLLPHYQLVEVVLKDAANEPGLLKDVAVLKEYLAEMREARFAGGDRKLVEALVAEMPGYAEALYSAIMAHEDQEVIGEEGPEAAFREYLSAIYNNVEVVNMLYGTTFASFDDITLPKSGAGAESMPVFASFLDYLCHTGPYPTFKNYLANLYHTGGGFKQKYGIDAPKWDVVELPQYRRARLFLERYGGNLKHVESLEKAKTALDGLIQPSYGIVDGKLQEALLREALQFEYGEFCTKEKDLWVEFVRYRCPIRFLLIKDADAKYQAYLKGKYEDSIGKLLSYYRQGLSEEDKALFNYKSFSDIAFPDEIALRNPDGTFFLHRPVTDDVLGFMASDMLDPVEDITVASPEYWWGRYLDRKYGGIDGANEAHSWSFATFDEVKLTREIPRIYPRVLQDAWVDFVIDHLPVTGVRLSLGNIKLMHSFLDMRYRGDIEELNKAYGTEFSRFNQVWPPNDEKNAKRVEDVKAFLHYRWMSPYDITISGSMPKEEFTAFLKDRFGTVGSLVGKCTMYDGLDSPMYPFDYVEWWDFNRNWAEKGFFWQAFFGNYGVVANFLTLHGRALFNTFVFCFASILVHTTVNPMCAYALSRFKLAYGHYILLFLLATMAFPPMVTMIPNFLMLKGLGLLNTYWALILPGMANGYSIFLLKGFFDSLPQELFEAGIIDGATEVQMFYRLAMPLSYPILAVIALWSFTGAYGAFMFAFIVCQNPKLWTLMVFLYEFQQEHSTQLTMAALTLASIPTLLVFVLAQRVILKGIVIPQMK